MVFPDEYSFYTARNLNSDFITDEVRKISLREYLLYLKDNPL